MDEELEIELVRLRRQTFDLNQRLEGALEAIRRMGQALNQHKISVSVTNVIYPASVDYYDG